jgi:tRNA nucleotidyltransferase/poly(A) polymerase
LARPPGVAGSRIGESALRIVRAGVFAAQHFFVIRENVIPYCELKSQVIDFQ